MRNFLMTRLFPVLVLVVFLSLPVPAKGHPKSYATGVQRDAHGHIARSPAARREFMKQDPCPSTGKTSGACPGYVVDHIQPLKRGGADAPDNMQWQTIGDAKEKDKWE